MSAASASTMTSVDAPKSGKRASTLERDVILVKLIPGAVIAMCCIIAFSVRFFSVIKYESMIHEFDPYFNWRVTQRLVQTGFKDLWNWFDTDSWYPLGRNVGGTLYPGLHSTSALIYWFLQSVNIPVHIREVCVLTGPLFSAFASLAAYGLVKEARNDAGAGMLAAFFLALLPSFISRSVAGSYDNEAVAIFAMVNTLFLYVKTLKTGSLVWGLLNGLGFFYMIASWGGYSFVINIIPIHAFCLLIAGRFSWKLYIAYAPFIVYITLLALSLPVVGFQAVRTGEHMASYLVFILIHIAALANILHGMLPPRLYRSIRNMIFVLGFVGVVVIGAAVGIYLSSSPTFGWSGRSLTLLDPTYASKYIPIIASVSEHQPTGWQTYFNDMHMTILAMPAGLFLSFFPFSDESFLLVIYGIFAVYFSGVMIRLLLVLGPASCCLGAVAVSELLHTFASAFVNDDEEMEEPDEVSSVDTTKAKKSTKDEVKHVHFADQKLRKRATKSTDSNSDVKEANTKKADNTSAKTNGGNQSKTIGNLVPKDVAVVMFGGLSVLLVFYLSHGIYMGGDVYSSPSVVLHTRSGQVIDDWREAYEWMRMNTEEDSKMASWWDYGYQCHTMANRTVIVDNNTWNNTHIATVGLAMASDEKTGWEIFRRLDVDYVFVSFGAVIGTGADDIGKFLWMVRIASGVYPHMKESDYLGGGSYQVGKGASNTMLKSLMYTLSYYRLAELTEIKYQKRNYDPARRQELGREVNELTYFEEALSTTNWMVRIYKVLKEPKKEVVE